MEINVDFLRNEIIGSNTFFNTPYGKRLITYADYTASGKTLRFIENYLLKLQKIYANTHTVDSFTGKTMTGILKKAEKKIKQCVNANESNYIINIGTGTTGAIAKLCEIMGLYLTPGLKMNIDNLLDGLSKENRYNQDIIKDMFKQMSENKPIIFVGPYEHHSNYLIWKQSFADVVEINLSSSGEFDYDDLENKLKNPQYKNRVKIGAFSAASNVTGIKTDVYRVAKLMHQNNGLVFFDFAASAPYVEINMNKDKDCYFDAIFLSPHKFIGGPGSSGVLIINKHLYSTLYPPTVAGGGTVKFVSPYCFEFLSDVEARENAGTPGILQVIKASLVFELKEAIGIDRINSIEEKMNETVFSLLRDEPNIIIYGPKDPKKRISIFSFNIRHDNKLLHHKLVSKLLNDLFGIQSRAGCACAGPYAHRLLEIDKKTSIAIENAVNEGMESIRPGFVRVNFHYAMSSEEVLFIINAIKFIANYGYLFLTQYKIHLLSGNWMHNYLIEYNSEIDTFGLAESLREDDSHNAIDKKEEYQKYLDQALVLAEQLKKCFNPSYQKYHNIRYENLRWFNFINYTE